MVTALLAATSFALLFVSPHLTALTWSDFPSWKFLLNVFTYQLDHGNLQHFVFNYMFMVPYALFLEKRVGKLNFLFFYFLAGAVSAAVFRLSGAPSVGMIGSSGAAFGVFAGACLAFGTNFWRYWAGLAWLTLVVGLQFFYALNPPLFSNTAYWGHLGGAAAGVLLAYYFAPRQLSLKKLK